MAVALLSGSALGQQAPAAPAAPAAPTTPPPPIVIPDYKPVTNEMLVKPADADWPMYRRTYNGWGHSPLKQITTENVAKLKPAWMMSTGYSEGHEAPPTVVNGIMFTATAGNQILAIKADTGEILWRYKRELPADMLGSHPTNRGVALLGDKVFWMSRDSVLVA
ncbi:MAG: PQQ-binding-like beta-propeller repeat protein, partial [Devosia nanyangense]|nr:PQQ-binding-like beta-propeller repeat protein [Devosia nanyangense]